VSAPVRRACGSSRYSRRCNDVGTTLNGLLIVTAVAAERDAVANALDADEPVTVGPYEAIAGGGVTVMAGGVGPAAAAAATATALTLGTYTLVVSAGIGGGFAGRAAVGDVVEATMIVAADLGAQTATGFVSISDLGFGAAELVATPLGLRSAKRGPIFTVSTVTGTPERAAELARRGAYAEAMEGYGVAEAALRHGVRVAEVRAISNAVGARDRSSWDIPGALAALGETASQLLEVNV
jgi:futalosine hydrolase